MVKMSEEFYRIKRLPPYVFAEVNRLKASYRSKGIDIIDFGMGNPDMDTPTISWKSLLKLYESRVLIAIPHQKELVVFAELKPTTIRTDLMSNWILKQK
jgi:hypothetical protein